MEPATRERTIKCPLCPLLAWDRNQLARHLELHKTDPARPFHCTQCPSKFRRKCDLSKHEGKVHGRPKGRTMETCVQCGRAIRKGTMDKHLRTHREPTLPSTTSTDKTADAEGSVEAEHEDDPAGQQSMDVEEDDATVNGGMMEEDGEQGEDIPPINSTESLHSEDYTLVQVEETEGEEANLVQVEATDGEEDNTLVQVEATDGEEDNTLVQVEATDGKEDNTLVQLEATDGEQDTLPTLVLVVQVPTPVAEIETMDEEAISEVCSVSSQSPDGEFEMDVDEAPISTAVVAVIQPPTPHSNPTQNDSDDDEDLFYTPVGSPISQSEVQQDRGDMEQVQSATVPLAHGERRPSEGQNVQIILMSVHTQTEPDEMGKGSSSIAVTASTQTDEDVQPKTASPLITSTSRNDADAEKGFLAKQQNAPSSSPMSGRQVENEVHDLVRYMLDVIVASSSHSASQQYRPEEMQIAILPSPLPSSNLIQNELMEVEEPGCPAIEPITTPNKSTQRGREVEVEVHDLVNFMVNVTSLSSPQRYRPEDMQVSILASSSSTQHQAEEMQIAILPSSSSPSPLVPDEPMEVEESGCPTAIVVENVVRTVVNSMMDVISASSPQHQMEEMQVSTPSSSSPLQQREAEKVYRSDRLPLLSQPARAHFQSIIAACLGEDETLQSKCHEFLATSPTVVDMLPDLLTFLHGAVILHEGDRLGIRNTLAVLGKLCENVNVDIFTDPKAVDICVMYSRLLNTRSICKCNRRLGGGFSKIGRVEFERHVEIRSTAAELVGQLVVKHSSRQNNLRGKVRNHYVNRLLLTTGSVESVIGSVYGLIYIHEYAEIIKNVEWIATRVSRSWEETLMAECEPYLCEMLKEIVKKAYKVDLSCPVEAAACFNRMGRTMPQLLFPPSAPLVGEKRTTRWQI